MPDSGLSILAAFLGGLMCAELVPHLLSWLPGRAEEVARARATPVPRSFNSQPRFRALDPEGRA